MQHIEALFSEKKCNEHPLKNPFKMMLKAAKKKWFGKSICINF
jgi:hypothetical protein